MSDKQILREALIFLNKHRNDGINILGAITAVPPSEIRKFMKGDDAALEPWMVAALESARLQ